MPRPLTASAIIKALICLAAFAVCAPQVAAAGALCSHCDVLIGVGTTFSPWAWTGGVVFPITLELQNSRWELGAFRFATGQRTGAGALPPETDAPNPYWGFTAMRRWQLLHRGRTKFYFGFGAGQPFRLRPITARRSLPVRSHPLLRVPDERFADTSHPCHRQ